MAEQATERMVVSADPARCFEVSADIASYPSWAADIKEVTIDERDAEGRPSVVTFRAAAFGRSTSYTLAYDYSEAPGVLAWVQTAGRHHVANSTAGTSFRRRPTGGPRSPTTSRWR